MVLRETNSRSVRAEGDLVKRKNGRFRLVWLERERAGMGRTTRSL